MKEALETYISTTLGGVQMLVIVGVVGVIVILAAYRFLRGS